MKDRTGQTWILLLGGLVVWAAHFFLLYAFGSIFPASDIARWLTVAATLAGLMANLTIIRMARADRGRDSGQDVASFAAHIAVPECLVSITAILWQGVTVAF